MIKVLDSRLWAYRYSQQKSYKLSTFLKISQKVVCYFLREKKKRE